MDNPTETSKPRPILPAAGNVLKKLKEFSTIKAAEEKPGSDKYKGTFYAVVEDRDLITPFIRSESRCSSGTPSMFSPLTKSASYNTLADIEQSPTTRTPS